MAKEFLGEAALARLIDLIKTEFDKYIKTEEAQELIATELGQMETALADYVKFTDIASKDKAGVVFVDNNFGLDFSSKNMLMGYMLTQAQYNDRTTAAVICKGTLENIKSNYIKQGITKNTETLTDEEKATACEWLGAASLSQMNDALDNRIGSLDAALDGILELQDFYTGETFDELHEYAEDVIAGGES